ncbi:MAG: 2-hydroxyacyl-CoA dehydratase family protein [Desulfatiglans sp.]|nr:2-hydroxyacyl-CoA dehydratase family protein [Thermodesulfobacteriota bacterium]MEE4354356.1 2-hydroxyacyl-CoA dehydratase family protein [Desulfatiglans sp.]
MMTKTGLKTLGLAGVEELYQNKGQRAKELAQEGRKVIGYFCCYVPLELFTALDIVPYRIHGGTTEPITEADAYLETIMCPFIRSAFDLALKNRYDFLDGLVIPHTCDTVERLYDIWTYYREPVYSHFINVPHMLHASSFEFFKKELETYRKSLEDFAGKKVSDEALTEAVKLHNENRALVRELYSFGKPDPPLAFRSEILKTMIVGLGLPVEDFNDLLRSVIQEIKDRNEGPEKKAARVLIYGSVVDEVGFVQLVEESGANVVMDDLSTGSRAFWEDVEVTPDPLDGISNRYLDKIHCPRTYRPQGETPEQDLENRFGHIYRFVKDFNANAVVLYVIRFCDTYELDAPDFIDYMDSKDVPVLYLEDEYSATTLGQLKTRVQAFLEMFD